MIYEAYQIGFHGHKMSDQVYSCCLWGNEQCSRRALKSSQLAASPSATNLSFMKELLTETWDPHRPPHPFHCSLACGTLVLQCKWSDRWQSANIYWRKVHCIIAKHNSM